MDTWADYIFEGDQEGWIYLAGINSKGSIIQSFVQWPRDRDKLLGMAQRHGKRMNLYFCPSLFAEKSAKKKDVIGSWVSWADCDAGSVDSSEVPQAGLVVASGSGDNTHRYWRGPSFANVALTEERNVFLRQHLRADPSGIDANQLLRIPDSYNHKRNPPAKVHVKNFERGFFDIPILNGQREQVKLDYELLPLELVLAENHLKGKAKDLFVKGAPDRSSGLYRLAAELRENGIEPDEIYTLLHNADERWGKFSDRDDKGLRISEIVARTSTAVSFDFYEEITKKKKKGSIAERLSLRELISRPTADIKWLNKGVLRKGGFVLVSGRQGVGKSQFCMNWGLHLTLSKPFIDMNYEGESHERVLFASHEMDEGDVKNILAPQLMSLSNTDRELALDRFDAISLQEIPMHLDRPEIQSYYERHLADGFSGIIIDSLSASISTSLKDDIKVREVLEWIDKIRSRFGVWVILITHPRKQPPGARYYETTTDDVYGDNLITQRPGTVIHLQGTSSRQIELRYLKARHKDIGEPIYLERSKDFIFSQASEIEPQRSSTKGSKNDAARKPIREVAFDADGILEE